jgi:hypothetical protein
LYRICTAVLLLLYCLQDLMRFEEDMARQYIAEVVLALEYVHSKVGVFEPNRQGCGAGLVGFWAGVLGVWWWSERFYVVGGMRFCACGGRGSLYIAEVVLALEDVHSKVGFGGWVIM